MNTCKACNGEKYVVKRGTKICWDCQGTGIYTKECPACQSTGIYATKYNGVFCRKCRGTGIFSTKCKKCHNGNIKYEEHSICPICQGE